MSETRMNRKEYERLIEEDIKWLRENTKPQLERDHIIEVLKDSINQYYPQSSQCHSLQPYPPQPIPPQGVVKTKRKSPWH